MTIETAREWVRTAVRNFSSETKENIDRAIMTAGNKFCRFTRALTRLDDVTITADSAVFPLTTPIANGFRPERVLDVYIEGYDGALSVVDYPMLNSLIVNGISGSSTPTHIAFSSTTATSATLWPRPTVGYTAKLRYWLPFPSWTPGAMDGPTLATVITLPDDLLQPILTGGAAFILMSPNPDAAAVAANAKKEFEDHITACMGANRLGVKVSTRTPASGLAQARRTRILTQ